MRLDDCWIVTVIPLEHVDITGLRPGPFEVEMGRSELPEPRSQHLRPELRRVLLDRNVRRHRQIKTATVAPGLRLVAAEVLAHTEGALALFHWASDAKDSEALIAHVRQAGRRVGAAHQLAVQEAMTSAIWQVEGWGGDASDRATTIAIATALGVGDEATVKRVASQLAAGSSDVNDLSQGPVVDQGSLRIPHRQVQILRDGVAFLHTGDRSRFHSATTRTIGVDVVALSVLQREWLRRISRRLAQFDDPIEARDELPEVARSLRTFRHRLWWREVSIWQWPNSVLQAIQEQSGLNDGMGMIRDEIFDLSQQAATRDAQLTNSLLAIVAILSFPGLAGTIAPALGADPTEAGAAVAALMVLGLALVLSPLGRALLAPVRQIATRGGTRRGPR